MEKLGAGGRKLSAVEFLSIKEFDGKVVKNQGTLAATGTLATLTANTGKDMYLARAKVYFFGSAATGSEQAKIELRINGIVVEIVEFNSEGGGGGMLSDGYTFVNIGQKVAAGELITLELTIVNGVLIMYGTLVCFEEDTGTTPQIPST